MAKKPREEESTGNWMDTYGDMVTLLMTFFVLLYSMSAVDQEKYAKFVAAFSSSKADSTNIIIDQSGTNEGEFPMNKTDGPSSDLIDVLANASLEDLQNMVPSDFGELYEYLVAYTEKAGLEDFVELAKVGGDGCVFIRFTDKVFFDPDSAVLRSESYPLLDFLGNSLKGVERQLRVVNINGHTADPGTDPIYTNDWRLSGQRAANVAEYFEDYKHVDATKLLPIGYGKNYPVSTNDTPKGRERNRRVEMVIISNDSTLSDSEILKAILDNDFGEGSFTESDTMVDIMHPKDQAEPASGIHSLPDAPPVEESAPVEELPPGVEMESPYTN